VPDDSGAAPSLEVIDGGQPPAATVTVTQIPRQQIGKFRVPLGDEGWKDGVYKIDEIPEGNTEQPSLQAKPSNVRRRGLRIVARRPLWIRALGRALDTDEGLVQLAYYEETGSGQARFEWVSQGQLAERRQLVALSNRGVPVRTGNADRVEEYLDRARYENGPHLPKTMMAARSGAYELDAGHGAKQWGWLIGQRWIGPPNTAVELDPRQQVDQTRGYTVAGDEQEWFDALRKVSAVGQAARWLTYAVFAPPIMRFVGQRTFVVHHWAETSSGKSAIAKFGMSAWGDPSLLTQTFNRTDLSFTETFRYVDDLPVLFDELQASKSKRTTGLIYDLCLERGRGRSTKSGGLHQEIGSWTSSIRTTGEEPIVGRDKRDLGGQLNRTIQVCVAALKDRQAESIHRWMDKGNFGWGGLRFIEQLRDLINNNPNGLAEMKDRHERLRTQFQQAVDIGPRAAAMATIATAQALCLEWFFGIAPDDAEAAALRDAVFVGELIASDEEGKETLTQQAMQVFRDHRDTNREMWIDMSTQEGLAVLQNKTFRRLVGVDNAGPGGDEVWMVQSEANRLLERAELPPRRIWSDMRRTGILISPDGKPSQVRTSGSFRNRLYVVKKSEFDVLE